MTNVYEGAPDSRQSADVNEPVSRFRPRYRALTDAEKTWHDSLKRIAGDLESQIENGVPNGREKSIAMTKLEEAIMWAIKGLTA
jgi:hypothetical protein